MVFGMLISKSYIILSLKDLLLIGFEDLLFNKSEAFLDASINDPSRGIESCLFSVSLIESFKASIESDALFFLIHYFDNK